MDQVTLSMLMHLLRFISQKGLSSAFGRESEVWLVEVVWCVWNFQMEKTLKKSNNLLVVWVIFWDEILAPIQTIDNVLHEENQSSNRDSVGVFGSFADESDPTLTCQAFHVEGWLLTRDFLLATVCVCFQDVAWVCIPPSQHCQFSPNRSSQPSFLVFVSHQIHHHLLGTETLSHCCFFLPPQKFSEVRSKNPPKKPGVSKSEVIFFVSQSKGSEADVQAYRHLFRQIQSQNRDESGNLGSYWMKGWSGWV